MIPHRPASSRDTADGAVACTAPVNRRTMCVCDESINGVQTDVERRRAFVDEDAVVVGLSVWCIPKFVEYFDEVVQDV